MTPSDRIWMLGIVAGFALGFAAGMVVWWRESLARWRAEARAASAELRMLQADARFRDAFLPPAPHILPRPHPEEPRSGVSKDAGEGDRAQRGGGGSPLEQAA